jgi:hypothetical protein
MAHPHIHSLIRLDTNGLPTHGFRYECVKCGAPKEKEGRNNRSLAGCKSA